MSWGTELWDQYDNLALHTQKGLDFTEKFGHFLREKCAIEQEYAAKLKRLVKNNQPKKREEDDYQFTCCKGFLSMLKEVHDIASQHEVLAESLNSLGTKDVTGVHQESKQERKKLLREGADMQKHLQASILQAEASKRQYEKSFRDAEKAVENFRRADADINLSRAEVEKQKTISQQKSQQLEESKQDYGAQLQKTNQLQEDHYTKLLPRVFQQLQEMDERRITRLQTFVEQVAGSERNVVPIINTCIKGISAAAESMVPSEDSRLVVERYKSGFTPPEPIPFDDFGNVDDQERSGSVTNLTPKTAVRLTEGKGTQSGKKKKRSALQKYIFGGAKGDEEEDFSHLNPAQQKKKLQAKIESIQTVVVKETAERDGMLKMKVVYEQNPVLGDPNSIAKQLDENGQKLDQLKQELVKFEGYLAAAEGVPAQPRMENNGNGAPRSRELDAAAREPQKRDSLSDESNMSRSPSNLSVQSGHQAANPAADEVAQQNYQKESPDSGLGNNMNVPMAGDDSFDDDTDGVPPAMGSCRALYAFEAQNEGSISMGQDEVLDVIERDVSDGWTLVRRQDNLEEGYVPTTYVEITWY